METEIMILEYFKKKQLRLLNSVPLKFTRKQYMKKIAARERLIGLLGASVLLSQEM